MPPQVRSILGIDLNQYEMRVVEIRPVGTTPQVVRAGYVPMPAGCIDGDRIVYPDAVADTLRGLLNRMNVGTRHAVIGVGAQSHITRVLDIPRVPDDEVRMVIEGELAHYQILREGTGAFDYMRLHDPEGGPETNPQVLLMAAEERVIGVLREVASRAGLQLVALEPILLAMYRAAFAQIQAQPAAVCVAVSYARSEVAIADRGHVRLYRRVDIGSDDIVSGRAVQHGLPASHSEVPRGPLLLSDDKLEADFAAGELEPGRIVTQNAGALATEIQRSLDYYRREYPHAPATTRMLLATNDPQAEILCSWLAEALNLDGVLVEPPIASSVSRLLAAQLEAPDGLRFVAAAGLAMQAMPSLPVEVPCFDLARAERPQPENVAARGRLVGAIVVSGAIALISLVAAYALQLRTSELAHNLDNLRAELLGQQQMKEQRLQEIVNQRDAFVVLKRQGMPIPRLVDFASAAVDPLTGLTEFSIDRTGHISLAGESANERSMINTLDALKGCPYFVGTTLDSFSSRTTTKAQVVEFRVSSQLLGKSPPPGGPVR